MDMKALAKQLKTKQLPADRVIFELKGGRKLIFDSPKVVEADMMGNRMYQVMGEPHAEDGGPETVPELEEEDVELVMEKAGCSRQQAEKALRTQGGVAEAILHLSE